MLSKTFERFKFEEAFQIMKKWFTKLKKIPSKEPIQFDINYVKKMIQNIPFELNQNQKKIVNEIYLDLKKKYTTKRLIQGDVGTGKTIIAFIASIGVISTKKQVLMMSPTEILAKQHYINFNKLFPNIKTIYITSKSKNKKLLKNGIKNNNFQMIFGTHLLANLEFHKLGLIIIDETHKFGTNIKKKTSLNNLKIDSLYLTATPIPKTLITIFLDFLNVSSLKENPYKKKNIITKICSFNQIEILLKKNQKKNEQSYVVVPAIQENHKYFSIQKIKYFFIKKNISNFYILHGKKKTEEKEEIMNNFINDTKGILLTTSIIEVGIDIPNATMIIILGAENFGLSQLHQLRGRVGRNTKKNYCFLVSNKKYERLKILEKEGNGFKLSEFDLKNRGPGDFLGSKQSGFFKYNFLDISKDFSILVKIKEYFLNFYKKKK
jgi:ATP-dependent DNA helicase RecG